jgi:hypothetical protein
VPRVEREEFLNVGVVLFCRDQKFLKARFEIDEKRLIAFSPNLNMLQVKEYLTAFEQICQGSEQAGPIASLSMAERFRWLTAPRSTILQTSRAHSGLCADAEEKLNTLFQRLVVINETDTIHTIQK